MKRIVVALVAVALVAVAGCCSAEKQAVSRLEAQQEKIFTRYLIYVGRDAGLGQAEKDDVFKHVESVRDLTRALKKSLED